MSRLLVAMAILLGAVWVVAVYVIAAMLIRNARYEKCRHCDGRGFVYFHTCDIICPVCGGSGLFPKKKKKSK